MPSTAVLLPFALTAFVSLGVEREVSPPPVIEKVTTLGTDAKVAWNGDIGFVIWTDERPDFFGLAYGSRIDREGRLIDPVGIPLFLDPSRQSRALGVVAAGDSFVVMWSENHESFARRAGMDGSLREPPVRLPESAGSHLATNGSTILFASTTGREEMGVLATPDLGSFTALRLPPTTRLGRLFTVAPAGGDYVLFFRPAQNSPDNFARAVIVRADGSVDSVTVRLHYTFTAVWTGQDFFLAYAIGELLSTRRLSADLSTLSEFKIVHIANAPISEVSVVAGDAAGEAVISWGDANESGRILVHADNSVEKFPGHTTPADAVSQARVLPAAQLSFAAPRDGVSGGMVFTEEAEDGAQQVMFKPAADRAAEPVQPSGRDQFIPAVASSGRTSLVAWVEASAPAQREVVAKLLDQNGEPITERIAIQPARGNAWPHAVRIAWTGQMYVIAWTSHALRFIRVLENGTVIDSEPTEIPSADERDRQQMPSFARIADVTFLVWTEGEAGFCGGDVACHGSPARIRGARFTAAGTLLDPNGFTIAGDARSVYADVAAIGSTGLVVWQHEGTIYGRRITDSGALLSPIVIARDSHPLASVTRHGDDFLVSWYSYRLQKYEGRLISRWGVASERFTIETPPLLWTPLTSFTMPSGDAALSYLRVDPDTAMVPRLFWRQFEDTPTGRVRAVQR